jgi:hypothetical protein
VLVVVGAVLCSPMCLLLPKPLCSCLLCTCGLGQVKSKPAEQAVVDGCVEILDRCGALDECVAESKKMVADAWEVLDAALPESFYKIYLRTIGNFVTQDSSSSVVVTARC